MLKYTDKEKVSGNLIVSAPVYIVQEIFKIRAMAVESHLFLPEVKI